MATEFHCRNCYNDYFFVLYVLPVGDAEWELLKCIDCGILRTEKVDTIREF